MELVCIVCPRGCNMKVKKNGDDVIVSGNACKRGYDYALQETICPRRIVTSSAFVQNGDFNLVSVKTDKAVPKDKIGEVMKEINDLCIEAPVQISQVLLQNAAGTDANIIATRRVKRYSY